MRIRILGGGWYGCHVALALHESGHEVELHEMRDQIFRGASGNIPARLHLGFHYPRSYITRAACREHFEAFMARYGFLTAGVPVNIYAVARDDSFVDYQQYVETLRPEVPFVPINCPDEFGLENVEGAVLTGERHILSERAREYFEEKLDPLLHLNAEPGAQLDDPAWDWTIDCTFCSSDAAGVDRYEPCLVLLMQGGTERAVTIMDGPFGSLYPWDEDRSLCSLSSARWTPFSKRIRTYGEAERLLERVGGSEITQQAQAMINDFRHFYPAIDTYEHCDSMLSIRAMPRSGADTRLVDVRQVGERAISIRAGKIDAVIHAEQAVREIIDGTGG